MLDDYDYERPTRHQPLGPHGLKGKHCAYCSREMRIDRHNAIGVLRHRHRTRQHIIPRREGGSDSPENIRWCCHGCNQTLAICGECPGAMAAAFAVAEDLKDFGHYGARKLIMAWGMNLMKRRWKK